MRTVANHDFSHCPRCGARMVEADAFTKESEFWLRCSNQACRTFINTYIPQEHQANFHRDDHRICANFGGYGSGKTTTTRMELEKHIMITPSGTSLIGANVASQYEQTLKREFEADFPKEFVAYYSSQKSYMDFINGHRFIYRPYDDADKLRSYNLTSWVILEASEVKEESYTQLKTRLRNTAAAVQDTDDEGNPLFEKINDQMVPILKYDWRKGIIESNPAAGWIKTSILNCSDELNTYGETHEEYYLLESDKDPQIATHITATTANAYLPKDFIELQVKNRPKWWVERYIYGSFLYSDGLVYPSAPKWVVPTSDIPRNWKRICAFDYGLADPSCFLFGAIDTVRNKLIFYKEVYARDRNVEELAKLFYAATKDIPIGGWVCAPIIDPKSGPKRDYDKRTLADNFMDYNISFIPGQVNREARVFRLNTYLESGRVEIMDCCTNLIEQSKELKFKANPSSTTQPWKDEPEDKNDHAIVCAEWIVMELPKDPAKLMYGAYNSQGLDIDIKENAYEDRKKMEEEWMVQALQDEKPLADPNYFYSDYTF